MCARACVRVRACVLRETGEGKNFSKILRTRDPCIMTPLSLLDFLNSLRTSNLFQLVRVKNPRPGNSLFRDFHEFSFSSFFLVLLLFLLLLGEGATPPLDIISNDWTTNNRDPPTTARVAGDVGTFARRNVRILLHSIAGLCLRRAQSESRG